MSTSQDLKGNQKSFIRKVYTNKNTLSVNIPVALAKTGNIKSSDYLFTFLDQKNRLVFEKVNLGLEE